MFEKTRFDPSTGELVRETDYVPIIIIIIALVGLLFGGLFWYSCYVDYTHALNHYSSYYSYY